MTSNSNLTTTVFHVVASKRTTFLRTEVNILIEQAVTTILDGSVIDAFRFETRYSEMRDLRVRLCQYIRKLYRNDIIPELPEITSSSTQQAVDDALRAVENLFEFIYQRKYLVESPLYRGFMHYKKKIKPGHTENTAATLETANAEQTHPVPNLPNCDSGTDAHTAPVLTPKYAGPNVNPQDYMIEASALLIGARRNEAERHFPEAYDLYKLAIQTLLEGARQDNDAANVKAVKQKIAVLLEICEKIYETHLNQPQTTAANPLESPHDFAMADLRKLFQDYKIIGIDGKIVMIQEKETRKLQAVKILKKALKGVNNGRRCMSTIVPVDVDRLARLASLHETETSVLLMLEYIPGGLLFSRLGLAESYPPPRAKNPNPIDPQASILHPALRAQESLRRKWSLNLSTSDWSSSFVQQRNRTASTSQKEAVTLFEESDSSVADFQHILTQANQTSQNKFSMVDFSKSRVSGSDSAFVEPMSQSLEEDTQIVPPNASEEPRKQVEEQTENKLKLPPIENVRRWGLQLLDALEGLHRYGFVWGDMNPNNILYDAIDDGIRLTFVCSWVGVDINPPNEDAARHGYVAPELLGPFASLDDRGFECDYWSFGAFLFNLVVGYPVGSFLGDMMQTSTASPLDAEIAEIVKEHVKCEENKKTADALIDLLLLLLKKNPGDRLSAPDKIRAHSFFDHRQEESM